MNLWQTLLSVLAAFIGVQSNKNRLRDFSNGTPLQFALIGLIVTITFIASLLLLVNCVLG